MIIIIIIIKILFLSLKSQLLSGQVFVKVNICTYAKQNSCERVEVNHLSKLGINITLSVPINLEKKRPRVKKMNLD